jgi:IS5 family transposase
VNSTIAPYWLRMAPGMFPMFDEPLGEANNAHYQVMATLDLIRPENWIEDQNNGQGRPRIQREAFLRAFIAKVVLNITTVVALIDRLKVDKILKRICGWIFNRNIPCEATFSNAFAEFSASKICERIHSSLVANTLKNDLVFHISRDSTAILSREAPPPKKKNVENIKFPRGRPRKGTERIPPQPSRLERQNTQSLEQMLSELHGPADYGAKIDSHGNLHTWLGYKLHIDVGDGGIPISAVLTPASTHDSGVSKPLQAMTKKRVTALYVLGDKGYDAASISENIMESGQVPIIPQKSRRNGSRKDLEKFEKERYKNRSTVERVNSLLKDRFGGRDIFVKGPKKVMCHLMFGLLALTAEAIFRLD